MSRKAKLVEIDALSQKSKPKYVQCYNDFVNRKKKENVTAWSENVLLVYISELIKKYAPNTLFSIFSMLKTMISLNHHINIGKYSKVTALLKKNEQGYKPKKSEVFTASQVKEFLDTALDDPCLPVKVAMIFGVIAACQGGELWELDLKTIKQLENGLLEISLLDTKNKTDRTFTVEGQWAEIVKKYVDLRPKNVDTSRFFLNHQRGKCTKQHIGKNKIASWPRKIATFLNLENPTAYTGHSFRGTSATLLANSGAGPFDIQQAGGWKSIKVAQSYIHNSIENRRRIFNHVEQYINHPKGDITSHPSTSSNVRRDHENLPKTSTQISENPQTIPKVTMTATGTTVVTPTEVEAQHAQYYFSNCTVKKLMICKSEEKN